MKISRNLMSVVIAVTTLSLWQGVSSEVSRENRSPVLDTQYSKIGRVDHMFNLLADIEPSLATAKRFEGTDTIENEISADIFPGTQRKPVDPSTLKSYIQIIKSLSKVALQDSKVVEDAMETVSKATQIYEQQINSTHYSQRVRDDYGSIHDSPHSDSVIHSVSRVITHLLKPSNIEKVMDISNQAKNEDQILQQLMALILDEEGRDGGYGSSITLDPVTCIALVTLAAYLIRAVFQITVALNENRSFGSAAFPFHSTLSHLPEVMLNLHNLLSKAEMDYGRSKREIDDSAAYKTGDSLLDLSTEMALFLKLNLNNQQSCTRLLVCYNLVGKPLAKFGLPEVFWTIIGWYNGDSDLTKFLSKPLSDIKELCGTFPNCGSDISEDLDNSASCVPCPLSALDDYLETRSAINRVLTIFVPHSKNMRELITGSFVSS